MKKSLIILLVLLSIPAAGLAALLAIDFLSQGRFTHWQIQAQKQTSKNIRETVRGYQIERARAKMFSEMEELAAASIIANLYLQKDYEWVEKPIFSHENEKAYVFRSSINARTREGATATGRLLVAIKKKDHQVLALIDEYQTGVLLKPILSDQDALEMELPQGYEEIPLEP